MSIRLKQLAISVLVNIIRFSATAVRTIWWFIILIGNPFLVIIKTILKPIALFLYRIYFRAYSRLKKSKFFQNKVFFIFGNRYFIHVIIILITLFVTSTNIIQAKDVYDEDFGKKSGLYKIVGPEQDLSEEIVEKGLPTRSSETNHYINTDGLLVANIAKLDPNAEPLRTIEQELQLFEASSALVSNTNLDTAVGIRADFLEHEVKTGESVGSLANRYGLTVNTILWANDLSSTSYIKPGDTLTIPPKSGYTVEIKDGDTLEKLVKKHKGDLEETLKMLGGEEIIPVGTKLVIANGEEYIPPPPPKPVYTSSYSSSSTTASYSNRDLPSGWQGGTQLNWPVGCRNAATTYWGHGLARDIACPMGTSVYAAETGTVYIRNSGGWGGGYGNYVDVVHGNGMMTRYAHLSGFNISNGQSVSRGQVIGFVGSTGRSTGPHLHFEVQINGVKYEPLNFIR